MRRPSQDTEGRQGPGAAAFPGAGRWKPPRGSWPVDVRAREGGTPSARSWTGAVTGLLCPLRSTAWGRRAPGLPLLFLLRWARPRSRKPPAALPTFPGTTAAAVPRRPAHRGRTGRTDAPLPRRRRGGGACAPSPAWPRSAVPLSADRTCAGRSDLESRSETVVARTRIRVGGAWNRTRGGKARSLARRQSRACEAGAETAWAAGPARG